MTLKGLKWSPVDASGLDDEQGEHGDVRFGLEEMQGEYEIVNGQIIFKPSGDKASNAESSEKKKKEGKVAAETKPSENEKHMKETQREKPARTKDKKKEAPANEDIVVEKDKPERSKSKKRRLESSSTNDPAEIVNEDQADSAKTTEEEEVNVDLPEWEVHNLHPSLLKGLHALGFTNPTPIQSLCIPAVLVQGKDILGAAETGSGKTLAYGLPILSFLMNNPPNKDDGLPALIVTPTRELALQVTDHLRNVLAKTPLKSRPRIEPIVGGIAEVKQERLLSRKPEIVVATMGRLQVWIGRHDYLSRLRESLRFLVVDEADRMTDKAHYADIVPLVDLLGNGEQNKELVSTMLKRNKKRQTLLFSATLLNPETESKKKRDANLGKKKKKLPVGPLALIEQLGMRGKPLLCNISSKPDSGEAIEILKSVDLPVSRKEKAKKDAATAKEKRAAPTADGAIKSEAVADVKLPDTISFFRIDCTEEDKEAFLHWILSNSAPESATLVFVNTIAATKRLAMTISMSFSTMAVSSLHANMEQKQRLRNLDRFKQKLSSGKGKARVLIASDVAARGLDIPDVDTVIHFGVPSRLDTFIHRSGRCARAGRPGTVVALATGYEARLMGKIRNAIAPKKIEPYPVKELELKRIFAQVRVCKQLVKLQIQLKLDQQDRSWKKRTAEEADIELDSDYEDGDEDDTKASVKRTLARKERNQQIEQIQYDIAKLKRELAYMLSGRAEAATNGGQHRAGRKRAKI